MEDRPLCRWAGYALFIPYVYMVLLVTGMNFKTKSNIVYVLIGLMLVAGPTISGLAVLVDDLASRQELILLGYFCHFVFFVLCFFIAQRRGDERSSYLSKSSGLCPSLTRA